ncbi:hypothetical protein [Myxococcus faecalis]|uniref:hypothetical protein n=1 Tax=Myxococcus faecalis TaxID=3115646 RepID=UPI003CEEB2A4
MMDKNLDEGPTDPTLHDEDWRAFRVAMEENGALAKLHWSLYRRELRRLQRRHWGRVPEVPMRRALAEEAFLCATHWKKNRRTVREALRAFLEHPLGVSRFTFAAAEYWKWASSCSPRDVSEAEHMLVRARSALETANALTRQNLKAMLTVEVDRRREARPSPISRMNNSSMASQKKVSTARTRRTKRAPSRTSRVVVGSEVVRTLDLEPMVVGGEELRLRIEICRALPSARKYFSRLWRIEHYRIQSTFPQQEGRPAHDPSDQEILMLERDLPLGTFTGRTANTVLQRLLAELRLLLDH